MKLQAHTIKAVFLTAAVSGSTVLATVKGSAHDLSTLGRSNVCSYCHTPHGALPKTPAWNHKLSTVVYKIYQSSSLDASVGQPTGNSKMCLSCHDGTVALTSTAKGAAGGVYITPGSANLGTDLSDDHPISFVYSDSLSARDPQIRPTFSLPQQLKLDRFGEVQCTTCHDVHDNKFGKFLVMSDQRSAMCTSCHDLAGWVGSVHETSAVSIATSTSQYLKKGGYPTPAEAGCRSCHRPHAAGGHERLLHHAKAEDNCFSCHDGSISAANIKSAISKFSGHNAAPYKGVHDPMESPISSALHVECVDCHNPHAVATAPAKAPAVPGVMLNVSGVTAAGSVTRHAQHEYEVCFKCHGDNPHRVSSKITRYITQTNTRLEFDPSGPSFHPVVSFGVNKNVPSLKLPMTAATIIYCTDCHSSDSASGLKGPHGSIYSPILAYNYQTSDFTSESEFAYELCYRCHSRNSILENESFPEHRKHLENRIPCSACHDPHGISSTQGTVENNSHLINFDTTIVSPGQRTGRLEFLDRGLFRGECYLTCHGKDHEAEDY